MAFTKTSFGNLRLSLAYRYGETSIPTSGDSNRNFWLNKGVQYLADKLQLMKSDSLTVASSSASLPDDFKGMGDLIDSNGVYYSAVNPQDNEKKSGTVFWITGNQADGFTLNTLSDNDGTYTLWYYFFPVDMTSNDDICIIPDGEAVVAYAYGMLRKSETDPLGDAADALGEAENRLRDMRSNLRYNEQALQMETLN